MHILKVKLIYPFYGGLAYQKLGGYTSELLSNLGIKMKYNGVLFFIFTSK